MPGTLLLSATWNHEPFPASDQTSLTYLLVDITQSTSAQATQVLAASDAMPLNVSLVLDTSGSMAGAKLQNLKKAVAWVIDHLTPQDTIAITFFDDEVRPLMGSTTLTDRKALKEKVEAISEAGGTAMSKGLEVGLAEAKKGFGAGSVSRIVLLTDGQTWGDAERCKELAAEAGAAGIAVTALGVGAEEDWSIELLDAIARESGGLSGYIEKPEEIAKAFQETLLSMKKTVASNLRLTFNPAGGVGARAVYRVAPVISKLWPAEAGGDGGENRDPASGALTLPLGELESGAAQTLLYEVVLPPRKPGQYRLARLLLNYSVGGQELDAALDLVLGFESGAGRGPGNPRVMNNVERATTFKLQTRALHASMLGDVATATRNLRSAATRLLSIGETELAETAEAEAQRLESEGRMSSAGTKKLAFDTRKLNTSELELSKLGTTKLDD